MRNPMVRIPQTKAKAIAAMYTECDKVSQKASLRFSV